MVTRIINSVHFKAWRGQYSSLANLWVLRLFKDGIADATDVRGLVDRLFGKYADPEKPVELKRIVRERLTQAEREKPALDGILATNLNILTKSFGLNKIEREIFAFRVIYRINIGLENTLNLAVGKPWTDHLTCKVLSSALKIPIAQIENALSRQGRLNSSGLVRNCNNMGNHFDEKLDVLDGIVSALTRPASSIDDLLSYAITKLTPSTLSLENYPHHKEDIDFVERHLRESMKLRTKGVNILLHGVPGIGKTELVRILATKLCADTYEVTQSNQSEENDGYVNPRFRAYTLLQKLLSRAKKGLILFDEIEDVIPKPTLISAEGPSKAWFNRLLENNPVPTIWVSNHVWQIDPAFMRRFDIILELRTPPRSVRTAILAKKMSGLPVDEHWIEKKAGDVSITPAMTERIVKVIRSVKVNKKGDIEKCFDRLMQEHRNALGEGTSESYPTPKDYRLDLLNTNANMEFMANSLAHAKRGRILLYGPPGCGKTAFAHYLSEIADRPLMLKRASDLISMWLGETEKNLREMFREATQDDAVLLLDEADSFLQERRGVERSWELTQVNELLTQMENFQGMFICATNFMEHLDMAAMRRFAFKVKFDYLRPDQAENLFFQTLKQLNGEVPDDLPRQKLQQRLVSLDNLTPGDFAAVIDQFTILAQQPSMNDLFAELSQACELKNGGRKKRMGFAA